MASGKAEFHFKLNGIDVFVPDLPPQTTLLDYVRSRGLIGAKEGCAEGECGACAVLFVANTADGVAYQAVNSCLIPLPAAAGREVYTVESLAQSGQLADVQREMAERGGSQCGYCTPGFIVSMFAEQYRPGNAYRDPHALGGNLCRCTGYRPIQDAFRALGAPPDDDFKKRLDRPAPDLQSLEYQTAQGCFSRPTTLQDAIEIAAGDSDSQFVAGNTDLGVLTNLRDQRFAHLISLEAIPELRAFHNTPEYVEIGAALTLTELASLWTDAPDTFREWITLFASPLIRNRATLGGSLATASPIGDSAPLLLALDAEVCISGPSGERTVPLDSFFTGYRRTVLTHAVVLRAIRIPKPLPEHVRFYKVAKRRLDDISTVAGCFAIANGGRKVRVALGGVAPRPVRVPAAEQALQSDDLTGAKDALSRSLTPISDHRGSAPYRLAMAENLLEKFWIEQDRLVTA